MTDEYSLEEAIKAYREKRFLDSQAIVEAFLTKNPTHAYAWKILGVCLDETGRPFSAIAAYQRALDFAPPSPGIHSNMGNSFKQAELLDNARTYHEMAVQEDPRDSRTWMNYALTLKRQGHQKKALEAFEKSTELDKNNTYALFNQGLIHLALGKYKEGWPLFEARIPSHPEIFRATHLPTWNGEPIEGKTLLLLSEQGFGDAMMISRFIPQLKKKTGARIILLVKPELYRIFEKIEGVDQLFRTPIAANELPPCDKQLYLMSLPHRLKMQSFKTLPPPPRFSIPETSRQKMASLLNPYGKRFKIGIIWTGKASFESNALRSMPLELFLKLYEVPGVELFSLFKGPKESEISRLGLNALIQNLGPHFDDFADAAAAIEKMDLIIMTDSGIAHLAGSLQKPTWLLLQKIPYWAWLEKRVDSPWYPSMTLYRQKTPGDWDDVMHRVIHDLHKLVHPMKKNKSSKKSRE